ncbi:hypothetical protein JYT16_00990 [Gemmatimonas aurantiaca]|nr:hypothetical protein [Gemmatimonas aurantiaca]
MTSPRSLRWGITFIAVGIYLLLIRQDTISLDVFEFVFSLWPIFLIAIGVEMIFKRTDLKALGFISPVIIATVFWMAGHEAYMVEQSRTSASNSRFSKALSQDTDLLKAKVELGDYDLYIRATSGNKLRGRMTGAHIAPLVDYYETGSGSTIEVTDRSGTFDWDWYPFSGVFQAGSHRYPEYKLEPPSDIPFTLEITGEDSNVELNLKDVSLTDLLANIEGISMSLTIGTSEPLVDVTLSGLDNRLLIRLPNGAGLRIDGAGITSDLSKLGLERENGIYSTPGFDTLTPQVNVHLSDDLERLQIKTY